MLISTAAITPRFLTIARHSKPRMWRKTPAQLAGVMKVMKNISLANRAIGLTASAGNSFLPSTRIWTKAARRVTRAIQETWAAAPKCARFCPGCAFRHRSIRSGSRLTRSPPTGCASAWVKSEAHKEKPDKFLLIQIISHLAVLEQSEQNYEKALVLMDLWKQWSPTPDEVQKRIDETRQEMAKGIK